MRAVRDVIHPLVKTRSFLTNALIKRKTRKQGNSVMINIPSEFKVEEGKEYTLVQKKDGTITLIPQIENYFENARPGEFYEPLEWEDVESSGRELDM